MYKRLNVLRQIEFSTLFLLALLSPFIFNLSGVDIFRLPKEVFSRILIALIIGVCFIEILERVILPRKDKKITTGEITTRHYIESNFRKVFFLPALIVITSSLSLFSSESISISIDQLLTLSLFISIPYIIYFFFNNLEKIYTLINVSVVSGFLTSVYCIIQFMGKDFLFKANTQYHGTSGGWLLTSGFIDNPNLVGGYLSALVPLALTLFYTSNKKTKKVIFSFLFFFISAATILTRAKTSLISFFISIIFFFICMKKYVWKTLYKSITFWVFSSFCVIFFSFYIFSNRQYVQNISKMGEEISFKTGERTLYWTVAAAMMLDRPFLGHGIGTYKYHYLDYMAFLKKRISTPFLKKYKIAQQAHNDLLQFGAETGFVGFFLVLALIFYYFSMGFNVLKERAKSKSDTSIHKKQIALIGFLSTSLSLAINSLASFPFHIVPSALIGTCVLGFGMVVCFGEIDIYCLFFKDTSPNKTLSTNRFLSQKLTGFPYLVVRILQFLIIVSIVFSTEFFLGPLLADMHLNAGLAMKKNKHLSMGIYRLKEGAFLDPNNGKLRYELGVMELKAAESSENNFVSLNRSLYLIRASRQFKLAEKTFKFPALNFLSGYCQELMKNKVYAYAEYSKALFYNSNDSEAFKRRAQLNIKY